METSLRTTVDGDATARARGVAIVRLASLLVVLAAASLVDHRALQGGVSDYVFAATGLYAAIALALSFSRSVRSVPAPVYAVLDVVVICALAYTSGGASSELRYAFSVLPVIAALLLPPKSTAVLAAATLAAYLAVSTRHAGPDWEGHDSLIVTHALYLCWGGLVAVVLSDLLTRRGERIAQLAAGRGRLIAQALDAESRERRRLAEKLHDDVIQNLLAVHQDLLEVGPGNGAALVRARATVSRTVRQLRGAMRELHPSLLSQGGLDAALEAVAEEQGRRGGFRSRVAVAPDAMWLHDQLVFSCARELLVNAAKHARASDVTASVVRDGEAVLLEVADNGRGIRPRDLDRAADGRIGLAVCADRVEAAGGTLAIRAGEGGHGTVVHARIPIGGWRRFAR